MGSIVDESQKPEEPDPYCYREDPATPRHWIIQRLFNPRSCNTFPRRRAGQGRNGEACRSLKISLKFRETGADPSR